MKFVILAITVLLFSLCERNYYNVDNDIKNEIRKLYGSGIDIRLDETLWEPIYICNSMDSILEVNSVNVDSLKVAMILTNDYSVNTSTKYSPGWVALVSPVFIDFVVVKVFEIENLEDNVMNDVTFEIIIFHMDENHRMNRICRDKFVR